MILHDHHFHPIGYAVLQQGLDLSGASSLDEVLAGVAERASRSDGAIIGHRFDEEGFADPRLPTAADIDDVLSDRPVLLIRRCGHIAVANRAALALAAIDEAASAPEGGSFDRDRGGRPTGVLRENAIRPVAEAVEPLAPFPTDQEILEALSTLPALGFGSITGIVSAGGGLWGGADEVDLLARIAPDLPIDIDVLVIADSPADLAESSRRLARAGDDRVRFLGWKGFSDGSLGGHTAALRDPYADMPETTGMSILDHGRALEMGQASLDLGGVVAIHAIGDLANDLVLDVMEELIAGGADPGMLRVEHASLLTDRTIQRFADLEVTASVQPAFIASDAPWLERRLGASRMGMAYPFRSLLEAGVRLIGGSDSPVESPDPEPAIAAAMGRPGLDTGQAITEEQARALFLPTGTSR